MTPFVNTRLCSLLCGFRDGYSTQHALFHLIEACRSTLDKKGYVGMVLMDLSKAYDCLPHDLLIEAGCIWFRSEKPETIFKLPLK